MIPVIEIRNKINYLNERTSEYDIGHPTISDAEWDKVYFELDKLEKEYQIYFNDSPTQTINYQVVSSLEKIAHNHEMLSLEKTKSLEEIKDFLGAVPYLAMCKMDGLTCSLKYENGELVSAETRGDGKVGENILHNAKVIPTIPKSIPYKETLVIDGEIICTYHDFENFSSIYKNPRNFASGSIRLLDSKECSTRKLKFVAWEVIEGLDFPNLHEKLSYLREELGFVTVPWVSASAEFATMADWAVNVLPTEAEKCGYPIDGLVFKFDNIEYGKSLGQTSHHFKNAMAYKFYDDFYETKLLDIEWSMGRTGQISPIALFETVNIDGTDISRASLSNLSIMKQTLGDKPFKGQIIEISKRNQIIPKVERAKGEDGEWI